jgi:hypothetical protein
LPKQPDRAVCSHKIEGRPRADKGHIREQQKKQQGGEQYGVAVSKRPHKSFDDLHGGLVLLRELYRLGGEQKTQDERQCKGYEYARVLMP